MSRDQAAAAGQSDEVSGDAPCRAARIPWVEVSPDEVYAAPDPSAAYRLHDPSLSVWREAADTTTPREVRGRLAAAGSFADSPSTQQVLAQVCALRRLGLIEPR